MELHEYTAQDAVGLAELIRRGEIHPQEVIHTAMRAIETVNPTINAVVHERFEKASIEANSLIASHNLSGVPFLLKDSNSGQAGVQQTLGNVALKQIGRTHHGDSALGRRFRELGLVTLGVTNIPEFGQLADTQPYAFGSTRNPWSLNRSAGGSSGGAAAAVASRMVPIAHASDGGGSIRSPAAWCGVVGLKPTRGRMPRPVDSVDSLWSTEFVLTRTVRDAVAVLTKTQGPLPGDLYGWPLMGRTPDPVWKSSRPLRIGLLMDEGPGAMTVAYECSDAVSKAGRILQESGHDVSIAHPSALLEEIPGWVNTEWRADKTLGTIRLLEEILGRSVLQEDIEPFTWWAYQQSSHLSADQFRAYLRWHLSRSERILRWWAEGFDLLITPVVGQPPDLLEELGSAAPEQTAATERRHVAFTEPFNASGQPAISVPVMRAPGGHPVGVQMVAARGEESLLLHLASLIEEAVRWSSWRPSVTA